MGKALLNICIMQAKKTRSGEKIDHGGGKFPTPGSISAGKKLLSWADQHGQDQHRQDQDQRQQKEEKKERRGRSAKSSGKIAKKDERSAIEDKSVNPSGKVERTLSEDDLTKELLSLLGPPPKIHIPDSLDPSKVKQFLTLGVFSSPLLNRRTELDQDQLGRGEGLVAANVGKDSSDMRGRGPFFQVIRGCPTTSSAGCANVNEEEKSCRVQSYHIIRLQYFIYFRWGEVLSLQQLLAWQAATVRRQQGGGGGHCHHCHHCLLTRLCHHLFYRI